MNKPLKSAMKKSNPAKPKTDEGSQNPEITMLHIDNIEETPKKKVVIKSALNSYHSHIEYPDSPESSMVSPPHLNGLDDKKKTAIPRDDNIKGGSKIPAASKSKKYAKKRAAKESGLVVVDKNIAETGEDLSSESEEEEETCIPYFDSDSDSDVWTPSSFHVPSSTNSSRVSMDPEEMPGKNMETEESYIEELKEGEQILQAQYIPSGEIEKSKGEDMKAKSTDGGAERACPACEVMKSPVMGPDWVGGAKFPERGVGPMRLW